MLWQPSLPDRYQTMPPDERSRAIDERRRELGSRLCILGHHYQTDEIIRHADHTGDSLKLSQIAAKAATHSDTQPGAEGALRWIIFCGVHFMAETADMLAPPHVEVILPDLSAGCSMADMAQHDDTLLAWDQIHQTLHEQGFRGKVIPITYVNSSAAIKAFVGEHGGACCTSSNAREVFDWAVHGGVGQNGHAPDVKILFLPDQHLGRNTAAAAGIDVERQTCVYDPRLARRGMLLGGASEDELRRARVILWAGHCSVHKLFRPEHCEQIRANNKIHPGDEPVRILVHPECCKEVVDLADLNGSTEFIIKTIREAKPGSRWAVGTEVHLVNRLAREARSRGVHVQILSDCQCLCTTMYRIDEPHLLWVLDHLTGRASKDAQPKSVNVVRVHPQVREKALLALQRMLSLSGKKFEPGKVLAVD
jgi:quinolinate synthase